MVSSGYNNLHGAITLSQNWNIRDIQVDVYATFFYGDTFFDIDHNYQTKQLELDDVWVGRVTLFPSLFALEGTLAGKTLFLLPPRARKFPPKNARECVVSEKTAFLLPKIYHLFNPNFIEKICNKKEEIK